MTSTRFDEEEVLQRTKYRELARRHLGRLRALFTRFTGLSSRLCWAPIWPHQWSDRDFPTHSRLCRTRVTGRPAIVAGCCRGCAARHFALALRSGHSGHVFTCRLGVRNFWLPIVVRGCPVGLAFVQAGAQLDAASPGKVTESQLSAPARNPSRRGRHAARRATFREAAKLLRLVFQHVETAVLADLRKTDLARAEQAVRELQTVATRLRRELNGLVPAFNKLGPELQLDNHTDSVVRAALEYIYLHYCQPLTLRHCAERLRLNPAYLSAQFSRAVGIPFKAFLTEVRLEKARALLGDPARNVADVAYAVGYASENRFRLAFKKVTGLPPRIWRDTLRMPAMAGLAWCLSDPELLNGLEELFAFGMA